jgi:arginine utilization protein RocB
MIQSNDTLKLLTELVSIPSDTNTTTEVQVESLILEKLKDIPKLCQDNTYGLDKIENDAHKRSVVWGLVKGKGKKTFILLNHHDVVDTQDYGNLQNVAYMPIQLKEELKKQNLSNDVMKDLQNDDWMFGRGTSDMKGGLVLQLKILEKFSKDNDFCGNLLFISVPDEENLSLGMRHSAKLLDTLSKTYDLDYLLLINSEPHERINEKFTVYDSSVGKTMAIVYVQGQKSHIGKIFEGVNPLNMLSRIMIHTELNSEFSDKALGETSMPPSWSFARDFKKNYDASIPEAAGGYLSFLTLNSTPKKILNSLKDVCYKSYEETVAHLQTEYKKVFPNSTEMPEYKPNIKFYEELYYDAISKDSEQTNTVLTKCFAETKELLNLGEISIPESNFIIIDCLLKIVAYNTPTIVIALSPPYYPHITSYNNPNYEKILDVMKNTFTDVEFCHYFMGISDLSYIGLQNENEIIPYVSKNMPLWKDEFYTIPFEDMKALSIPTLIIGPWGKDLHKKTERVYVPDLVENVPKYIEQLITNLL